MPHFQSPRAFCALKPLRGIRYDYAYPVADRACGHPPVATAESNNSSSLLPLTQKFERE
jgi:hypothetical protein